MCYITSEGDYILAYQLKISNATKKMCRQDKDKTYNKALHNVFCIAFWDVDIKIILGLSLIPG